MAAVADAGAAAAGGACQWCIIRGDSKDGRSWSLVQCAVCAAAPETVHRAPWKCLPTITLVLLFLTCM